MISRREYDVKKLAWTNPRMALGLILGVPRVPFVGDFHLQFTSAAVGAVPVEVALDNNLTQDTMIERIAFSCFQQNSFAGSPFQSLYFAQLKQCTGVGVQLQVFGSP